MSFFCSKLERPLETGVVLLVDHLVQEGLPGQLDEFHLQLPESGGIQILVHGQDPQVHRTGLVIVDQVRPIGRQPRPVRRPVPFQEVPHGIRIAENRILREVLFTENLFKDCISNIYLLQHQLFKQVDFVVGQGFKRSKTVVFLLMFRHRP